MVKKTHFRCLFGQLWIHRAYLILSLVLTFSSAAFFLIMPRWASVVIQEDTPRRDMAPIIWHLLAGIAIFLTGSFLGLARAYTTSIFLHTLGAETRLRIFHPILR